MRHPPAFPAALALALSLVLCAPAQAGRPLASEDAGTAELGTCQIESWLERSGGDGAWVLAPACGTAKGLEIGADYTLPQTRDLVQGAAGVGLKWAPENWKLDTAAGELNFGLKLAAAFVKPIGSSWQRTEFAVLGLASLQPAKGWALHANLGLARDRASSTTASLLNLALMWSPSEQGLVFLEAQANNRRSVLGGTTAGAGGRWWLVPETIGVDFTSSREVGASGTHWSIGVGWYGLGR